MIIIIFFLYTIPPLFAPAGSGGCCRAADSRRIPSWDTSLGHIPSWDALKHKGAKPDFDAKAGENELNATPRVN